MPLADAALDVREASGAEAAARPAPSPGAGAAGRAGREAAADPGHPGLRLDRLAARAAEDLAALSRGHQGDPVRDPPPARARLAGEQARRRLPLPAPAGAVRGLRGRHRSGDLRGVRLRRGRAAPSGEGGPRRVDGRPVLPRGVPQGLREQVRPAGLAPRLLRRRHRGLPGRLGRREVLRRRGPRARRPAPGRRVPRPGPRARHRAALADHDLQPPPRAAGQDRPRAGRADGLLRRRRSPAQHGLLQLRPAAAQARAGRRRRRPAVHVGRTRRAPPDRRAGRLVRPRRRPPRSSAPGPTCSSSTRRGSTTHWRSTPRRRSSTTADCRGWSTATTARSRWCMVGGRAVWRSGAATPLLGHERTGQFLRHGEPAPALRPIPIA